MCNPRRVQVTATRQVREAWEREVRRAAAVSAEVGGEARIRQPLDASVGGAALMALQLRLDASVEGWGERPDGSFRHNVDGGYVLYDPGERVLEIVATLSQTISDIGVASRRIGGTLEAEIATTAEADYYDDGWGGHTEEHARAEAERKAQQAAEAEARERQQRQAHEAEQAVAAEVERDAITNGQARLDRRAEALRPEVEQRARERLGDVGIRARQAFHRLLALAYRDALEALARRRGVDPASIATTDNDQYLEIEFELPD